MFGELLSIVAPVYLCIAVGYAWRRFGRRVDNEHLADLCTNIGAPCLVFSSLIELDIALSSVLRFAGVVLVSHAVLALLAYGIAKASRLPATSFLAPLTFANTGNIGLPVCLFAFGESGLAYAVVYFSISSVLHFTVGQWLWTGRASMAMLFRTPLSHAVAIALLVLWLDLEIPLWLLRTTENLGAFTIPLMQFMLGVSLAELVASSIGRYVVVSLGRFALAVTVAVGLAELFSLEGDARGVLILYGAMPAAIVNYLFAVQYRRTPEEVASFVVVSTTIAFFTLPWVLYFLI